MKFGLYLGKIVKLIDCETGEILACGSKNVNDYLHAFEGKYTLQLIQCLTKALINDIMNITKGKKRGK